MTAKGRATVPAAVPFSGSFVPGDVTLLLTPLPAAAVPHSRDLAEKERALASGALHYGDQLSPEALPDPALEALYAQALAASLGWLPSRIAALARALSQHAATVPHAGPLGGACGGPAGGPVLVSLARAGLPLGILLARALRHLGWAAPHYGVSILRGRGLDPAALSWLLQRHPAEALVFVDGWTAKGGIRAELDRIPLPGGVTPRLAVLHDLAGVAQWAAAGEDDRLIPWAVLNATVSGLISRTVTSPSLGPGQFHGTVVLEALAPQDHSRALIETLAPPTLDALSTVAALGWDDGARRRAAERLAQAMARLLTGWGPRSQDSIKPGLGEATRAMTRRAPQHLLVRDPGLPEVRHLLWLAEARAVAVQAVAWLPVAACALLPPGHA